jgi:tetratricopeptide (TPR) repeat protein
MKQIKFIAAILMLTIAVNAQQESFVRDEPENNLSSVTVEGGIGEVEISSAARDFNERGVRKALIEQNYRAAAELFAKSIESDARCFTCRYNLGKSFINLEKYDDAIKIFKDLISAKPGFANAHAGLGDASNLK